ncbi:uncharacterized protein [Amphiura filiformis]|uniref:uncharacterized protein isoform X2 n=1 Tax=Amphiura filiformis TaxID=82378 RepID=UPI003B21CE19
MSSSVTRILCRYECRRHARRACSIKRYINAQSTLRGYCTTASAPDHQHPENNPLLRQDGLPEFTSINAKHVVPGVNQLVSDFEQGVKDFETKLQAPDHKVNWSSISDPLEKMEAPLEYGWGVVSHLNSVKNSPELREAYQQVQPNVVKVTTTLTQSLPLYGAMKKLNETRSDLDGVQQRLLDTALRSAKLGGVELTGTAKERFNEMLLQGAKLANNFSNNVLDSTKAFKLLLTDKKDVEGLPDSLLQLMAANGADDPTKADPVNGPWQVSLDMPCYDPFMRHSKNRELREQVYRAYIARASSGEHDNSGIIEEIRKLRQEQAKLLGYDNFAVMSLSTKMAGKVDNVWQLIHGLKEKSKQAAQREFNELKSFATSNGFAGDLQLWDVGFWSERQREQLFNFNDEDLRPFFPLPRVLEGMFNLTSFLFGVTIKPADGAAEVWHEDVGFFDILNDKGKHIASFFLDPYTRPAEKNGGAWMNTCQGKSRLLKRNPVAYLICNQTPPLKDRPSLMTFREAETLFHEFGHGLQHMLTTMPYSGAAGINNIEWDAVELPSQFMENWLYDSSTIKTVTGHYQTGETIPNQLFQQLVNARKYMAGSGMLRQLYFSALDMEMHTSTDPWQDVMKRAASEYTILHPLPEDRFPCGFSHIFAGGYAAGYYSYKWAEVMAADAFSAFEDVGLENREQVALVGKRFRDTVLSLGGGTHPMDVFKQFRGREPSPEALLKTYGL